MKISRILLGMSTAFIISSFSSPVWATEDVEVMAVNETKMIRMKLSNPVVNEINVVLYDRAERILYSDNIPAGSTFEDEFDLSTVNRGNYRLVTQLDGMSYTRIFKVSNAGIEFKESFYSFDPQFEQKGDILMLYFTNTPQKQVSISIEDWQGSIFEDYYQDPGTFFSVNYDLRELPRGTYTLHLESDRESHKHEFEVK